MQTQDENNLQFYGLRKLLKYIFDRVCVSNVQIRNMGVSPDYLSGYVNGEIRELGQEVIDKLIAKLPITQWGSEQLLIAHRYGNVQLNPNHLPNLLNGHPLGKPPPFQITIAEADEKRMHDELWKCEAGGDFVAVRRIELQLTTKELAMMLDVKENAIKSIEEKKRNIRPKMAQRLAEELDLPSAIRQRFLKICGLEWQAATARRYPKNPKRTILPHQNPWPWKNRNPANQNVEQFKGSKEERKGEVMTDQAAEIVESQSAPEISLELTPKRKKLSEFFCANLWPHRSTFLVQRLSSEERIKTFCAGSCVPLRNEMESMQSFFGWDNDAISLAQAARHECLNLFGTLVQRYRKKLDKTQSAIGEILGIKFFSVSDIERIPFSHQDQWRLFAEKLIPYFSLSGDQLDEFRYAATLIPEEVGVTVKTSRKSSGSGVKRMKTQEAVQLTP